jgi:GNAT superfamily N-acetyltransferase
LNAPAALRISAAAHADAAALRQIHVQTWSDTYEDLLPSHFYEDRLALHRTRSWESEIDSQEARGGGVLIARINELPAGLCQYGPTQDGDDRPDEVGHVHRLYVHPYFQKRGVGRSLLAVAAERLSRTGVVSLTLWALEADPGACAFYEHLGWRRDGARRFDGATDVRYRLWTARHTRLPASHW